MTTGKDSKKWLKLWTIRKDRDIFDLLTALIAVSALLMPFILRSCDRPKLSLVSSFIYKVNFETYPALLNIAINSLYPQTEHRRPHLFGYWFDSFQFARSSEASIDSTGAHSIDSCTAQVSIGQEESTRRSFVWWWPCQAFFQSRLETMGL